MKVLRSTEWEPISWIDSIPGVGVPGYVFLNKRYGDVAVLNETKYVDVAADDVFIYNASDCTVRLVCDTVPNNETSLPRYSVAVG